MLDQQLEDYVNGRYFAKLATVGRDGYPQITIMWYLYENGHFYMTTTTTRVKYHNVRRDPKVGFIIDSDPYKGLAVKGDMAGFLFDNLDGWNRRIAARYTEPERLDAMVAALMKDPRVILDIHPKAFTRIGDW
jgi:PPOX class probable F420-dependent enzyme